MGQVACHACENQNSTDQEQQFVRSSSPLGMRNSFSSSYQRQGSFRTLPPCSTTSTQQSVQEKSNDGNRASAFEICVDNEVGDECVNSKNLVSLPIGPPFSHSPMRKGHTGEEDYPMPSIRETYPCSEGRQSISDTTTTSSEGSENDKENQEHGETPFHAHGLGESKEERRRRKELRRKEKWLFEQEVEAEKRRELERHRKEEQRRIAREQYLAEDRKTEELLIQKRQEDASKLDKFLIEHNYVSINSKRNKEARRWGRYEYPLHKAVELADLEMVRILLDFGADTEAKNNNKKRPLDKARKLKMENWEVREGIITMLENSDSVSSYFRSNASTACSSAHLGFSPSRR